MSKNRIDGIREEILDTVIARVKAIISKAGMNIQSGKAAIISKKQCFYRHRHRIKHGHRTKGPTCGFCIRYSLLSDLCFIACAGVPIV